MTTVLADAAPAELDQTLTERADDDDAELCDARGRVRAWLRSELMRKLKPVATAKRYVANSAAVANLTFGRNRKRSKCGQQRQVGGGLRTTAETG
jgi:hypothetical protein